MNVLESSASSESILMEIKENNYDIVFVDSDIAAKEGLGSRIRKASPRTFRVLFSIEENLTGKDLMDDAYNKLILELEGTLAVVKGIKEDVTYLITPEQGTWKIKDKDDLINKILELSELRLQRTRLESVRLGSELSVSEELMFYFKKFGHLIFKFGLAPEVKGGTYGNLSIRAKDKGAFYITAKGVHKGDLHSEDIVRIDSVEMNKGLVNYIGKKEPSTETIIHALIYTQMPEVNAIVHGHLTQEALDEWKNIIKKTDKPCACGTLELAQEAIIWDGRNPGDIQYCQDMNKFQMYTKEQFMFALRKSSFSEIKCFSSDLKHYDPKDTTLYVIAAVPSLIPNNDITKVCDGGNNSILEAGLTSKLVLPAKAPKPYLEALKEQTLVVYPGYFQEFGQVQKDVVSKALNIFDRLLVLVLPKDKYEADNLQNKVDEVYDGEGRNLPKKR